MRPRSVPGVVTPSQGYVCLACRLQNARRLHPANRRLQHTNASPDSKEEGTPVLKRPFTERLRGFLSNNAAKQSEETSGHEQGGTQELRNASPISLTHKSANENDLQKKVHEKFLAKRKTQRSAQDKAGADEQTPGESLSSEAAMSAATSDTVSKVISEAARSPKIQRKTKGRKKQRRKLETQAGKLKMRSRQLRGIDISEIARKLGAELIKVRDSQEKEVRKETPQDDRAEALHGGINQGKTNPVLLEGTASGTPSPELDMQTSMGELQADSKVVQNKKEMSTDSASVRDKSPAKKTLLPTRASNAKTVQAKQSHKTKKRDENPVSQKASIESKATKSGRKDELTGGIAGQIEKLRADLDKATQKDQRKSKVVSRLRKPMAKTNPSIRKVIDFRMARDVLSGTADPPLARVSKNHDARPRGKYIATPRTAGVAKGTPTVIAKTSAANLKLIPVDVEQPPVPTLAYGLERVLFNPGVYQLQDPRSRVYNFDPYLQKVMPVGDFDFNALKEYITSSRDESLQTIGKQQGKRYVGSTSSMTGMLAHFHFLLSQWRPINVSMLSKSFPDRKMLSFTELQRTPAAIFLKWKDGSYAIDADKEFDTSNVLSMLGKSMEKFLTLKTEDFERYRRSSPGQVSEEESSAPESYHYSTLGDFLMRSQLDAHDPRLPGTGMFDLKTRAVVSIRMDVANYEHGMGYEIKERHGEWESFEREYFDMIRAAFLKYSMQVRMGRMDGIFVAFHNIERIFGFQYISLPEMDSTIHGQWDTSIGDQEFVLSVDLLNKILDKATEKFPKTSIRLHFETRDAATPFMYIFAEPVTEEQATEIQTNNNAKIEEFERNILGRRAGPEKEDDGPKWADIQANVEDAMNKDELSLDEPEGVVDAEDGGPPYANQVHVEGEDDISGASAGDGEDDEEDAEEDEEAGDDEDKVEDGKSEEDLEEEEGEVEDVEEGEDADANEEEDRLDQGRVSADPEAAMTDEDSSSSLVDGSSEIATKDSVETLGTEKSTAAASADEAANTSEGNESGICTTLDESATSLEEATADSFSNDTTSFPTEADRPFLDVLSTEHPSNEDPATDILAMTLTLRNKVNGTYVLRAENMTAKDTWDVEYSLVEVPSQSRAKALYEACQMRRRKKLDQASTGQDGAEETLSGYVKRLREMSVKARVWREEMEEKERRDVKKVLGTERQEVVKEED